MKNIKHFIIGVATVVVATLLYFSAVSFSDNAPWGNLNELMNYPIPWYEIPGGIFCLIGILGITTVVLYVAYHILVGVGRIVTGEYDYNENEEDY